MNPGTSPGTDTGVLEAPPKIQPPWQVVVHDDDWHTFDEVERQMQKATGCSLEVAQHIANTVHNEGRAIAYIGELAECERVAGVLQEIELRVTIEETP